MVLMAGWVEARSEGDDQRCAHFSLRGQRRGLEGKEVEARVIKAVSNRRRPKMPWHGILVMWRIKNARGWKVTYEEHLVGEL